MRDEDAQEMIDEADDDEDEDEPVTKSKNNNDKGDGGLVKEAVSDLDSEIGRIRKEKNSLNAEIKKIDNIIKNAEEVGKKVERLRYLRRVARLDEIEGKLVEKRKLQQKDESLNKRMSKVKGIKEKLSGV